MRGLRSTLLGLATGVALALPAAAAPIEVRFATISAPANWETRMMYIFQEYVHQAAPDQFAIEVFHSGSLLQQGMQAQVLERGTIEIVPLGSSWIVDALPEYGLLNAGYLLRDASHLCSVWRGEVGREIRERVSDELGFQVLAALYTGTRQVGLRQRREVATPADLAGLKFRMIGSRSHLFLGEALGANPTPMAFGEVYLALQTGTIDGQDNPLPTLWGAKFHEVLEQIVLTGHLVQDVLIGVSNQLWDRLEERQKEIFEEAAWAAADFATRQALRDERTLQARLVEAGLTVTTPDVEAFRTQVAAAYQGSDFSEAWQPGLWDRIAALETQPACHF
jgi:TRAP-type transport system periplasmic protein